VSVPGLTFRAAKRGFDVIAAAASLVLLSPVYLAIAFAILLAEGPPVLYRGVRTGRGGQQFRILKFRTMVVDAEREGGGSTSKNDPRVTRIGHVLRRYKLDELPQLLNVLVGEMSIVGPRPELPMYTDLYDARERQILTVRPGITDFASLEFIQLADVLGPENADAVYEREVMPRKNALRLRYVQQQSFRTDLLLIAKTLHRILAR
jgi:lipopolysaccharide/colanic/teichoic acid biosynthesis glycosyltransferase